MSVDLEQLQTALTELLDAAIAGFVARQRQCDVQSMPTVTRIELAFSVTPIPAMSMDFDVREDPQPDGEAAFPRIAAMERAEWQRMLHPRGDVVSLRYPDGTWKEVERSGFHTAVAEFLVVTLRTARMAGTFASIASAGGPMVTLAYDDGTV
jgi:hypothetical protein